jgi:hypothetical protein
MNVPAANLPTCPDQNAGIGVASSDVVFDLPADERGVVM